MSITKKARYYKEKYRTFVVKFSNEKDTDIINVLESKNSITSYIRKLIREDLKNE